MLDRKFIVDNVELVKLNCRNRNAPADVDRFVALEAERRTLQSQLDEANRKANETARSIGKAPPEKREGLKEEGRRIREEAAEIQQKLDRDHGRIGRDRAGDSQPLAPRRPGGSGRQGEPGAFPRQDADSAIRFQAAGSRRIGGETRFDRLRRRGSRGGARILLPQERRRAAGTGLAALCPGRAAQGRLHAHDHARLGPQRRAPGHRLHSPRAGDADL